jgi:hypothetical protein
MSLRRVLEGQPPLREFSRVSLLRRRSAREIVGARKRSVSSSRNGRWPENVLEARLQRQISFITDRSAWGSTAVRPGARAPHPSPRAPRDEPSPCLLAGFHAWTSPQQWRTGNWGDRLALRTRSSVSASAISMNLSLRLLENHVGAAAAGRDAGLAAQRRQRRDRMPRRAAASISSNSREGGTFESSGEALDRRARPVEMASPSFDDSRRAPCAPGLRDAGSVADQAAAEP